MSAGSSNPKTGYSRTPCWRERGLSEEGGRVADGVLGTMVRLAEKIHPDILRIVLDEAVFRARELPKRTAAYRESYFRKNGVGT